MHIYTFIINLSYRVIDSPVEQQPTYRAHKLTDLFYSSRKCIFYCRLTHIIKIFLPLVHYSDKVAPQPESRIGLFHQHQRAALTAGYVGGVSSAVGIGGLQTQDLINIAHFFTRPRYFAFWHARSWCAFTNQVTDTCSGYRAPIPSRHLTHFRCSAIGSSIKSLFV